MGGRTMPRFIVPRDIYFGRGSIDALKTLEGTKAFIVIGGGSAKKSGLLDKATGLLEEAGFETCIFEGVEPDPSVETVRKGAKAMEEFGPDWIVAIGGGSVIDASKSMWLLYEHPDADIYDINPFNIPPLRNKARFISIPTTSGTGSEVSEVSVLCDSKTGVKFGVVGPELVPDAAIVDPDAAASMPQEVTAHTGLDAMSHTIESFVANFASPFTEAQALYATKMIFDALPAAYAGDPEAREKMHYAQCIAGLSFSNSMLGLCHALVDFTGGMFDSGHIPHGLNNAIFMPYTIQFNSKLPEVKTKYAALARYIGIEGASDDELAAGLAEKARELASSLGAPNSLREYGVPEDEWNEKSPGLAASLLNAKGGPILGNPRKIDAETLDKFLTCIYEGTAVDF